jgi:ribonuclease inhibitor
MKKEVFLDGSRITSQEEFHIEISKLLSFPHYYGKNLDDLWYCLSSYIDQDVRIMINGFEQLQKVFSDQVTAFTEIFDRLRDNDDSPIEILIS